MPPPRPRGLIALPEGPSQRLGLGRDRREAQNPERGRRPCPRGAEAGRGRRRNEGVSRRPREGPLRRAKEIPRRGVGRGYAPRRGGERDGSADGDAITNPSRSSKPRRSAPPGCPPPIRRRPPQRGQGQMSMAKTRRSTRAPRLRSVHNRGKSRREGHGRTRQTGGQPRRLVWPPSVQLDPGVVHHFILAIPNGRAAPRLPSGERTR